MNDCLFCHNLTNKSSYADARTHLKKNNKNFENRKKSYLLGAFVIDVLFKFANANKNRRK